MSLGAGRDPGDLGHLDHIDQLVPAQFRSGGLDDALLQRLRVSIVLLSTMLRPRREERMTEPHVRLPVR